MLQGDAVRNSLTCLTVHPHPKTNFRCVLCERAVFMYLAVFSVFAEYFCICSAFVCAHSLCVVTLMKMFSFAFLLSFCLFFLIAVCQVFLLTTQNRHLSHLCHHQRVSTTQYLNPTISRLHNKFTSTAMFHLMSCSFKNKIINTGFDGKMEVWNCQTTWAEQKKQLRV